MNGTLAISNRIDPSVPGTLGPGRGHIPVTMGRWAVESGNHFSEGATVAYVIR